MEIDKDLRSVQEVRDLLRQAKQAQKILAGFDQDRIDRIVTAVAMAELDQVASTKSATVPVENCAIALLLVTPVTFSTQ